MSIDGDPMAALLRRLVAAVVLLTAAVVTGAPASTAQASTAQASTAQASTAQASTAQASTAQASTAQASTAQASTAQGSSTVPGRFAPARNVGRATAGFVPPTRRSTFNLNGYNWGGYVSDGPGGIADPHWVMIDAYWVEPAVTCNSTADMFAPWVGLDGYGSTTVEQTGVETNCFSGVPAYRAWYELFPAPPVYIDETTYPVGAGDVIEADVQYADSRFSLVLNNISRGWTFYTSQALSGARRVSAEIIIEAPGGAYPNFGTINFQYCEVNYGPLGEARNVALDPSFNNVFQATTSGISNNMDFSITYLHE
jgi:hypothetical protein